MSAPASLIRLTVKSVNSGDTIVVRGVPRNGPPPEKQLSLGKFFSEKIVQKRNHEYFFG